MIRWVRGSEVPITVKIMNNDPTIATALGALVDIDSVVISVWDQDGVQKVTDQAASNIAVGYYRYFAATAAAWSLGACDVEVVLTASSKVRILKHKFILVDEDPG